MMDVMDRLMRFQGSYQLTFFNQLMLESSIILKLFNTYGDILPGTRTYLENHTILLSNSCS